MLLLFFRRNFSVQLAKLNANFENVNECIELCIRVYFDVISVLYIGFIDFYSI